MAKWRGLERRVRAKTSASIAATTTLESTGTKGRVWAIALTPTTAATCTWTLSSNSVTIWSIQCPGAIAGDARTVSFPTGLVFTNGLIVTEVAGVGLLTITYSVDAGGTV